MASSSTPVSAANTAAPKSRKLKGELTVGDFESLETKITELKKQIKEERDAYVKERYAQNRMKMQADAAHRLALATSRGDAARNTGIVNKLSLRMQNPFILPKGSYDQDFNKVPEAFFPVTAKLPLVEKIPPFTTWVPLQRNQRTIDNRSVIGIPHIGTEQFGGRPLASSDDEEVIKEPAKKKHEFSEDDKRIIRMVYKEYEPSEKLLEFLTQFFTGSTPDEIHEVFKMLKKEDEEKLKQNVSVPEEVELTMGMNLNKSLSSCLASFDKLFCRQCLMFDCGMHLYNQPTIGPAERVEPPIDDDGLPCGDKCYRQPQIVTTDPERGGSSNINNADQGTKETEEVRGSIRPWQQLERDLCLKGLQIFGRRSCLITRNLIAPFRTCTEVYNYMQNLTSEDKLEIDEGHKGKQMVPRTELVGEKGGEAKKQKLSEAPSGRSSAKRIAVGMHALGKSYTPCQCTRMCGKDCPCVKNIICCEKYCGCSKRCKHRFRGCQCAAGQCRSQQCPCVAAGRECDPDICGNCWASCGDGSVGEPSKSGEGPCGNMKLLLREKLRVLFGKSDVAGWGAFVQTDVKKDEYLGEYTGELISHEEADLRGKYYDRANKSFLFNLNEELVLDACRAGNKLKFANHSSKPNCYAKITKVGGDHRVAIHAKEDLKAGQEIFYDYSYKPEQIAAWTQEPKG